MNINFFSWLSFFFGGAIGAAITALIVLFLERKITEKDNIKKVAEERKNTILGLKQEIKDHIKYCNTIIKEINNGKFSQTYYFNHLEDVYISIYKDKFIDYSKDADIKLASNLKDIKLGLVSIKQTNDRTLISNPAMNGHAENITFINEQRLIMAKELLKLLKKVKKQITT